MREDIKKIQDLMESAEYVTDPAMATSVYLAMTLRKPLLIQGHAGVGKTGVAEVMSRMLGTQCLRIRCYVWLDAAQALDVWTFRKQFVHIKLQDHSDAPSPEKEPEIFSEPFLIRRPLLQAITPNGPSPVLL